MGDFRCWYEEERRKVSELDDTMEHLCIAVQGIAVGQVVDYVKVNEDEQLRRLEEGGSLVECPYQGLGVRCDGGVGKAPKPPPIYRP